MLYHIIEQSLKFLYKYHIKSRKYNAANYLLNRTLKSGWEVIGKIEKEDNATGGFYSVGYKVKKNDEICFLKAFEYSEYDEKNQTKTASKVMSIMLKAYKYENDLSDYCSLHHVSNVIKVKESGVEYVEGFDIPVVPYLIFDLAEGDARTIFNQPAKFNLTWKLKSLHDIAEGLRQLHNCGISHQDLKTFKHFIIQRRVNHWRYGKIVLSNYKRSI